MDDEVKVALVGVMDHVSARIEALEAENARLQAEKDRKESIIRDLQLTAYGAWNPANNYSQNEMAEALQDIAETDVSGMSAYERLAGKVCAENEILRARNAELVEALRPFSAYGHTLSGQAVRGDKVMLELWDHKITVDDFRNAALTKAAAE